MVQLCYSIVTFSCLVNMMDTDTVHVYVSDSFCCFLAVGYELLLPPVCQSVVPGVSSSAAAPQHVHVQRDSHSSGRGCIGREGRHASESFTKLELLDYQLILILMIQIKCAMMYRVVRIEIVWTANK